jgi:hypothetical protein
LLAERIAQIFLDLSFDLRPTVSPLDVDILQEKKKKLFFRILNKILKIYFFLKDKYNLKLTHIACALAKSFKMLGVKIILMKVASLKKHIKKKVFPNSNFCNLEINDLTIFKRCCRLVFFSMAIH